MDGFLRASSGYCVSMLWLKSTKIYETWMAGNASRSAARWGQLAFIITHNKTFMLPDLRFGDTPLT